MASLAIHKGASKSKEETQSLKIIIINYSYILYLYTHAAITKSQTELLWVCIHCEGIHCDVLHNVLKIMHTTIKSSLTSF